MIRITRAHVQPIGVDIGFDSVKLLQLVQTGGQLSVLAAARQPLDDAVKHNAADRAAAAIEMVKRVLRAGDFVGRNVVAALPREVVQVKNLRLPQMPTDELGSAVQFEARNIFPFDTDQAQVRHIHAGEVRQGNDAREEVIVLAAKDAEVNAFLEQLHRAGLVTESLDFEPCAIYRGVERFVRRREDEQEVNVIVDIGARRTQVVIGRGREISFYKPIDMGGQHLQEAVVRKLGITPDEARTLRRRLIDGAVDSVEAAVSSKRDPVRQAVFDATRSIVEELAREISLCLRYYSVTFRGQRPGKIRLTGGEASDPHLQAVLKASLPLPVDAAFPLQGIDVSRMKPTDRRSLTDWAVAFGLGLKLTKGHFGSRDGRRRDPSASREAVADVRSGAEVIDLKTAVQNADASTTVATSTDASHPPIQAGRKPREVARA